MGNKEITRIARMIQARINCDYAQIQLVSKEDKANNIEWMDTHRDNAIEAVRCLLPHGSGLDNEWYIDFDKSHGERIVLLSSYHAMDDNGMYDRWINFNVVITASLMFGINISIHGDFGKYQGIRDYLAEIIHDAIS